MTDALEKQIAALEARLAVVEGAPMLGRYMSDQKLKAKIHGTLDTIDKLIAAPPRERAKMLAAFTLPAMREIVDMLTATSKIDVARGLPAAGRKIYFNAIGKAAACAVVAALAPSLPEVLKILSTRKVEWSMRDARGYTAPGAVTLDAARHLLVERADWEAMLSENEELRGHVGAGVVVVEVLDEPAVRAWLQAQLLAETRYRLSAAYEIEVVAHELDVETGDSIQTWSRRQVARIRENDQRAQLASVKEHADLVHGLAVETARRRVRITD